MLFRDEWLSAVEDQHLPLVFPEMRADFAARVYSGEWRAVVATFAGCPIGLAVVVRQPQRLVLGSLYVARPWRRNGVGRRLLRRILSEADRPIEVTYRTDLPARAALYGLLDQEDFTPPHLVSTCCEYRVDEIDFAQIRRWRSRPGLSVIDWSGLSLAQRAQLDAPWVPPGIDPRRSEGDCERSLSLALLHQGDLAGWFIMHRIQPDLLRCTSGYVQPARLSSGGFALLCQELFRRQQRDCPHDRTIWTVSAALPAFTALLRRRLQPAGVTLTEFHRRSYTPTAMSNESGSD